MDFMIFDKRNRRFGMMFIFALLLSSIEYTYGQVSLSGCANPVVYSSCDLTCQTPHQNADAVKYFKPPNLSSVIAQCADDGTCAAVGGYTIQRSTSTTTVITILNYTCTDSVTWRCDYDGKFATHDSPCVDFPQTATTTDMSDNSVVNSSVVITVDLGCLVSQGTVQMKFDYKNSGGTIVDSSALSTCSNVSTCTDPLYSTYECQVNLQKESNVLCETKYSIEANVKIADADRTESIHLLNDVEFTCPTASTVEISTDTTNEQTTSSNRSFKFLSRLIETTTEGLNSSFPLHDQSTILVVSQTTSLSEGDRGDKHSLLIAVICTFSLCGTIYFVSIFILVRVVYRTYLRRPYGETKESNAARQINRTKNVINTESNDSRIHKPRTQKMIFEMTTSEPIWKKNHSNFKCRNLNNNHHPDNVDTQSYNYDWYRQGSSSSLSHGQEADLQGYVFYRG